jgi:hypothetical protein
MFEPEGFDATPRSRWLGGSSNPPLPFSARKNPRALQSVSVAPFREDFTTDGTDDTDGKEKKKFGQQDLFIREIREIRGSFLLVVAGHTAPSRLCVETSSPVTPSQTWSNHFSYLDHARQINGSACPSTTYTPSHKATHRNQSNPVKPGQTIIFNLDHDPIPPSLHSHTFEWPWASRPQTFTN